MKVLMFGWEFPPFSSGGLGTACYGLTKGLSNNNIEVTFVLPQAPDNAHADFVNLLPLNSLDASKIRLIGVSSLLSPYVNSTTYNERLLALLRKGRAEANSVIYGQNLFEEVFRYSQRAMQISEYLDFDVIHCHDWMTMQAGINVKGVSGKPLVVHIHATEFDRTGGHGVNQYVYDIERAGMHAADLVIAVSNFTKQKIMDHYGVPASKIRVVHNAVDFGDSVAEEHVPIQKDDKIVLFLGRLTLQKGPDYFLEAARRVLDHDRHVKFVVAGSGDMEPRLIERAAELGMADKVLFAGFLRGADVERAYRMADVYVMPSVSEPFGITPLESMKSGTPVIISKQSGVSEVIKHCLTVDFWDINELSNKILAVLKYSALHQTLKEHGTFEVMKFTWNIPAKKCIDVYRELGAAA